MTIYAYLRASTDRQDLTYDAQRNTIAQYLAKTGGAVAREFIDYGISGGDGLDKREALAEALATLKRGDVLLVAKRDRLCRDALLAGWLDKEAKKGGWRIVSAAGEGTDSDDPTSMLMRRIIDAFAEFERLTIGFRTKLALKAKRARGERTGGAHVPYGFDEVNGKLREAPAEQATIGRIVQDRKGGASYAKVAAILNAQAVPTRSGAPWSAKVVRGVYLRATAAQS